RAFLVSKTSPRGTQCALKVLTVLPVISPSTILPVAMSRYSFAAGPRFCTPGENFTPAGIFGKSGSSLKYFTIQAWAPGLIKGSVAGSGTHGENCCGFSTPAICHGKP